MPEIVLTHVTKRWDKFYAVDDLNLVIDDNAFVTLLGPSGCGKTTTLRVVSGLEKPQNGIILMDGKEIVNAAEASFAPPSKRNLNLVFQSYALWPHMTVYDNIAFGLKIQKMSKAEIDRRVMDSLRMMRIDMYKDRYPTELSGGQQQRVAIARALAAKPAIILADEPTGNLDSATSLDVMGLLKVTAQKFSQTIVMITHNEELAQMADRIIRIEDGRIVVRG